MPPALDDAGGIWCRHPELANLLNYTLLAVAQAAALNGTQRSTLQGFVNGQNTVLYPLVSEASAEASVCLAARQEGPLASQVGIQVDENHHNDVCVPLDCDQACNMTQVQYTSLHSQVWSSLCVHDLVPLFQPVWQWLNPERMLLMLGALLQRWSYLAVTLQGNSVQAPITVGWSGDCCRACAQQHLRLAQRGIRDISQTCNFW